MFSITCPWCHGHGLLFLKVFLKQLEYFLHNSKIITIFVSTKQQDMKLTKANIESLIGKKATVIMKRTFIIKGGGQYVQQCAENGDAVEYIVKDTDYTAKSGVDGSNLYTHQIWASSLERLEEMVKEWIDKEIELVETQNFE